MLAKGLMLLEALGNHADGVGVSMLAREVGLPVSTTHRLLTTMVPLGFVRFDADSRHYSLGLKMFELSHRVSRGLPEGAFPVMRKVSDATKEPTFLAVLDGTEIVHIGAVQGLYPVQVRRSIGQRGPSHATSLGKALLALLPEEDRERRLDQLRLEAYTQRTIIDLAKLRGELDETRERGYAVAEGEYETGINAVGVPVMNTQGQAVAAISTTGPAFRVSLDDLLQFVPLLQNAALEIGSQTS